MCAASVAEGLLESVWPAHGNVGDESAIGRLRLSFVLLAFFVCMPALRYYQDIPIDLFEAGLCASVF